MHIRRNGHYSNIAHCKVRKDNVTKYFLITYFLMFCFNPSTSAVDLDYYGDMHQTGAC